MADPKQSKSVSPRMRSRARQLRRDSTIPERCRWGLLRDRRLGDIKFRRQHAIGPFVVDFYCPAYGFVVELDGRSHDDRGLADRERQDYLERRVGLRVLRVANDDVLEDPEAVLSAILRALGRG